jgi:hypothetical protein
LRSTSTGAALLEEEIESLVERSVGEPEAAVLDRDAFAVVEDPLRRKVCITHAAREVEQDHAAIEAVEDEPAERRECPRLGTAS